MFDSTLILSEAGIILNMDTDLNDALFADGVDHTYKNFTSLFKTSQTELLSKFLERVFTTGKLQTTEFFNGTSFYQLKCMVTQPGQALCIITNNTKNRSALSSLEEHNFKTLVDTYAECVWSFDTNFSLITANRAFLEIRRQVNDNEVLRVGDNIFKYVPDSAYKKWLPIYERALKGEIIFFEEKRNNGVKDYYVEIYLAPVYNDQNEIIGCLGTTRDITERKKAQHEHQEMEKIRANIAADFHDELGSTLSSIALYSQMAINDNFKDRQLTKNILSLIGESSRGTVSAMQDMIWSIQPKNDSMQEVIYRIREYAYPLAELKNIDLLFNIDEEVQKLVLSMDTRKNIYMLFKEALNNAFKYASASCITVDITKQNDRLSLQIKDNGKGFDQQGTKAGNGLANMQKRAEQCGGTLLIRSAVGNGTEILFDCPLG